MGGRLLSYSTFIVTLGFLSFRGIDSRNLPLIADTVYGPVQGKREGTSDAFLGVPFAQPPIGGMRWKDPQPPSAWKPEVLKADTQPPGCMQRCIDPPFACPTSTSEDCLYMDIYRPSSPESDGLLPVFVYLHGGKFESGSCSAGIYNGRILASAMDAVIVCINYRLGAFGYLFLGTDPTTGEDVNGNFGLKDQIAGLEFLKENLESFGGDPNKITLAGQSAGAQSVAIHMTTDEVSDLFQQGIMFSEPFALPLKTPTDAIKLGQQFVATLSCQKDVMTCLRSKTANDVQSASDISSYSEVNLRKLFQQFQPWGPVVEVQPIKMFENGQYQDKPVMLGSVTEEGRIFVYDLIKDPIVDFFYFIILSVFVPGKSNEILNHYPADSSLADQREVVSQLAADYVFTCPIQHVAKLMFIQKGLNVYHYIFDQVFSDPEAWDTYVGCYGHVCHGGDLPYIFGSAPFAGFCIPTRKKC
ncbi:putative cAMP-regulated D2 protein-like [Apostichopus japonicus]|uniref:Carboxylic ester hydrolase n=1 Tax=Stichopus japonicus TaxID=307972 RepID=A0A2G8K7N9_STIJA|nr:putative cAMP-regulated D2 protein-like [Apostichopus japonicus]